MGLSNATSSARAGGAGLINSGEKSSLDPRSAVQRGPVGLSYAASDAHAGAGLNSGEESGSGTPAVMAGGTQSWAQCLCR